MRSRCCCSRRAVPAWRRWRSRSASPSSSGACCSTCGPVLCMSARSSGSCGKRHSRRRDGRWPVPDDARRSPLPDDRRPMPSTPVPVDGEAPESDLRYDEAGRPARAIRHPSPLLESLVGDHLDPGYQAAADRRSAGPDSRPSSARRSRTIAYLCSGLIVVGLVLGIAAASTKDQAAGADQARRSLLQDIAAAQAKQSNLALDQSTLAAQIRSAQSALGAGGPLQTVQRLEDLGGLTAVTGPGLTVVIDGSTDSSGAGGILDRHIQLLVNGMWGAGGEAVSGGGVRPRTTSAIRQAGNAILVDNRPVFWPITIEAFGDPSTLPVNFVDTFGFGRFQTFVSLYGIRFDISAQTALTLAAGGEPDLQYASPAAPVRTGTPSASAGSPAGSTTLPTTPTSH